MAVFNKFTITNDDERRIALRRETKRAIAYIDLKRQKQNDLREIVKKLDADSDQAASEHQAVSSEIQAELSKLDEQHVDAIMAGKESIPSSIARRKELLAKIAELNQSLELRCEANKRAKAPIEKEIRELSLEIAQSSTLPSRLTDLASADTRRKIMLNSIMIQAVTMAKRSVEGNLETIRTNHKIETKNKTRGLEVSLNLDAIQARMQDAECVIKELSSRLKGLHQEAAELQQMAADE